MTNEGALALAEAEQILQSVEAWKGNDVRIISGLIAVRFQSRTDSPFYSQQHPIDTVWINGTPLIQKALLCWVNSRAQLEAPEFDAVRDYILAYRRHRQDWLSVSIGEKSSYATWLRWSWAKSAVGRPLRNDPTASAADKYFDQAYHSILRSGGVRVDHVYTKIPRTQGGISQPISYQRLASRCTFQNGDFALVTVVDGTSDIQIDGMFPDDIAAMDPALVMNYASD